MSDQKRTSNASAVADVEWDSIMRDLFDTAPESETKSKKSGVFTLETESEPTSSDVVPTKRVAVIRTSDRIAFKQCRRKWAWGSHLRAGLGPKQNAAPLWFGSGFHFVLEDYHGHRRFANPVDAMNAYAAATLKFNKESVPDDYKELLVMGETMLSYYVQWWQRRGRHIPPTYVLDGVPQVEVNFRVPIPLSKELLAKYGYDEAVYSGTIDAVRFDPETGLLWLLDYKTAKIFNTQHFRHDSQVTAYCWAASHMYGMEVAGMIYQQHLKKEISTPRVLKNGNLSSAKNQTTSHILYRQAILDIYGTVDKAPADIVSFLNGLARDETARVDKFIRLDFIYRNQQIQAAEGVKALLEAEDMLDPNLALYPNPGRDCTYMCSFNSVCTSLDDGSDWEHELKTDFAPRPKEYDGWRECLVWPGEEPEKDPEIVW